MVSNSITKRLHYFTELLIPAHVKNFQSLNEHLEKIISSQFLTKLYLFSLIEHFFLSQREHLSHISSPTKLLLSFFQSLTDI